MDKANQERIINELCNSLRKGLLDKLPSIPEEWDGIDLRNWMVDYVATNYTYKIPLWRKRRLNNDIIVKNLT